MNNPILCPYCGNEMEIGMPWLYIDNQQVKKYKICAVCKVCRSIAPNGLGETKDEAIREARQAARKRYVPLAKQIAPQDLMKRLTQPVWTEQEGWGIVSLESDDNINYRYSIRFAKGWQYADEVFKVTEVWDRKPDEPVETAASRREKE